MAPLLIGVFVVTAVVIFISMMRGRSRAEHRGAPTGDSSMFYPGDSSGSGSEQHYPGDGHDHSPGFSPGDGGDSGGAGSSGGWDSGGDGGGGGDAGGGGDGGGGGGD